MVSLLVLAPLALTQGQTRPPTLDPTYGFPLPTHQAKAQKAPPDADWIWTRETKDNQTVYFRKLFDVAKMPNTAKLYITADDFFTVYLNGKAVGA